MLLATPDTLRDVPADGMAEGAEHPPLAHQDTGIPHCDFSDMNSVKTLELI